MSTPVRIENWSVCRRKTLGYTAPELIPQKLMGYVYGHPKKPDGTCIETSALLSLDLDTKRAKTESGTEYALGTPDPDYVAAMGELGIHIAGKEG